MKKIVLLAPAVLIPLALIAWGGLRLAQAVSASKPVLSLPLNQTAPLMLIPKKL